MAAEESLCKFNRVNKLRKKGCLIHPNVSREIGFAKFDKPHRQKQLLRLPITRTDRTKRQNPTGIRCFLLRAIINTSPTREPLKRETNKLLVVAPFIPHELDLLTPAELSFERTAARIFCFSDSPFYNFPILEIPRFRDSLL